MKIGYARTSTTDQVAGLDAQVRDLEASGVEKIFQEQVSATATREQLGLALDFIREGDVLVVTKLDRLARSVRDLMDLVSRVEAKKASLQILDLSLDTSTATGRLMLGVLGAVAEFERSIMLERQREGIEKAKAAGKYKGRKPTARAKEAEVLALLGDGETELSVATKLGISRSSVQRIKKAHQTQPA